MYVESKIGDCMKKLIIGFILGGLIFGSIGIYAASYYAKDVSYEPSDASWEVNNVDEAINSLYSMKQELDTLKSVGDATSDDIAEGKTAVVKGNLVTGTKSDSTTVIYLGTGNSFNLTSYEGYEKFTADNFIVEVYSGSVSSGHLDRYNGTLSCETSCYATGSYTLSKTYNASSGVLTVNAKVNDASSTGWTSLNPTTNHTGGTSSNSTALSKKVYLIQ